MFATYVGLQLVGQNLFVNIRKNVLHLQQY